MPTGADRGTWYGTATTMTEPEASLEESLHRWNSSLKQTKLMSAFGTASPEAVPKNYFANSFIHEAPHEAGSSLHNVER